MHIIREIIFINQLCAYNCMVILDSYLVVVLIQDIRALIRKLYRKVFKIKYIFCWKCFH